MSFARPTLSQLIERARLDIEARLPGADAKLRHQVLDVLARTHSGALAGLYGYADWISRQILPDTAEAEVLARQAAIWGITRKAAVSARGTATLTGVNGADVPIGSLLARVDGAQYRTLANATIAAGSATVAVEAVEPGPAGAMAAGQALSLVQLIGGVSATAQVANAIVGGVDEEDDESLLRRLLQRIQQPPHGGSKSDYIAWTLAQPGVSRAWVFPQWLGVGTVGVTFVVDGRDDIFPSAPEIAAVQAALDELRPVTAEVIVFALTPRPIDIHLAAAPASPAVQAAIVAELDDMFLRDADPGGVIRRSRLSEAISIAAGEQYHELMVPGGDVAVPPGSLPVRGVVSWG